MGIPKPTRPSLSGYIEGKKLLPWMWVDARMSAARNYWITTHAEGFPSSRPVWGIWMSPQLIFSTGSLIARHMTDDAHVQINLESADEVVLVEGLATPLENEKLAAQWSSLYNKKYRWDMAASTEDVWVVHPARVLAWVSDSSGLDYGAGFSNSATQWTFDPTPS